MPEPSRAAAGLDSSVVAGRDRERQLAREKFERQQQRRTERQARARRSQRIVAAVVVVALVAAGAGWIVATSRSDDAAPASPAALASALASAMPAPTPTGADAPSTEEPIGEEDCAEPGAVRADTIRHDAPGDLSDPALSTQPAWLSLQTNCGDIVIETQPDVAPLTVASQAFLAESGFYDGTRCHRLTTEGIFVLQCGDPAGNGTGGPGYAVPDENLPEAVAGNYPAGTVAMANAGPGTAGSQFFITYADTTLIPAGYTVWGRVESGLDIVQRIAAAGVAGGGADGEPAQPVVIDRATVSPIAPGGQP